MPVSDRCAQVVESSSGVPSTLYPASQLLHRFAFFTACATFLLIIAGGLVTSTGSGLAVPDWPLSYGTLFPPMVGGIRFEHSHRVIAAAIGLLTIVLAVWLQRVERRRWVRRLGWAALGAVVLQGVLGGLTVLYQLPVPVSVAHACLGQTFFGMIVALALVTSPMWMQSGHKQYTGLHGNAESQAAAPTTCDVRRATCDAKLRRLAWMTCGFVYLQLILGALMRHTGAHAVFGLHVLGAVMVAVHAGLLLARTLVSSLARGEASPEPRAPSPESAPSSLESRVSSQSGTDAIGLPRLAVLLVILIGVQLLLGGGAYLLRWGRPEPVQPELSTVLVATGHVAVGALILATSVVIALWVSVFRGALLFTKRVM